MTEMEKEKEEILEEKEQTPGQAEEPEKESSDNTEAEANSVDEGAEGEAADKDETDGKDSLADMNDKYMRLAAEYQNFRRRTEQERVRIAADANERIAKDLLNVLDSFERALETAPAEDDSFKSGVDLIFKQLSKVLENFGVAPIDAEGKEFDPNFHNAVLTGEEEGVEAGMVLQVLQKGYMLRDRVLRPSMVKVSV